jgi:hypothetical protein
MMGDLAREPMHWPLLFLFWVTLALTMPFYRFR